MTADVAKQLVPTQERWHLQHAAASCVSVYCRASLMRCDEMQHWEEGLVVAVENSYQVINMGTKIMSMAPQILVLTMMPAGSARKT